MVLFNFAAYGNFFIKLLDFLIEIWRFVTEIAKNNTTIFWRRDDLGAVYKNVRELVCF